MPGSLYTLPHELQIKANPNRPRPRRYCPFAVLQDLWPSVTLYDKQREVIQSVEDNKETYVPAGNMLGKDFLAGYYALFFFLTRYPCKIVTTSVKDDHLRVLWGEIDWFIRNCRVPLTSDQGGPFIVQQREIRRAFVGSELGVRGAVPKDAYLIGSVSEKGEGLSGHHLPWDGIPRTLAIGDEASGLDDKVLEAIDKWAHRILMIGNTWPCRNFFRRAIKDGDQLAKGTKRAKYLRRIIRIRATDSPNVKAGLEQQAKGKTPTGIEIIPGVKGWEEYQENLQLWSPAKRAVALDAEFWEGADELLFPPFALDAAEQKAIEVARTKSWQKNGHHRVAKGIGVDSAEGGDNTVWCAVDEYGLIELMGKKTRDTSTIVGDTIAFMLRHRCDPSNVVFDRGGGGKQHADWLRAKGYKVRTVGFGETLQQEIYEDAATVKERRELAEERYRYRNRRAQLFGETSLLLEVPEYAIDTDDSARGSDTQNCPSKFALPGSILNRKRLDGGPSLREQLAVIPLRYDEGGRMYLPPKYKKPSRRSSASNDPDGTADSLYDLIGCSPDEADALVMAVYAMNQRPKRFKIRSMV